MATDSPQFTAAYHAYNQEQWLRFASISALVAAVLVPLFGLLDWFAYPEHFRTFVLLRLLCASGIAFLAYYGATKYRAHVKGFTLSWFFLVQILIAYMIWTTEGPQSGYYAGLNLAIIGMGLILPARVSETAVFCVATALVYMVACILNQNAMFDKEFLGNFFFLVSTAFIAVFSTYFLGERRYKEFLLSFQLSERNSQLADLNARRAQFFANISHELRTPLTLILAPVEELMSEARRLPDHVGVRLGVVRGNALRLLKLVNDLLDVIRLEERAEEIECGPLQLNSVLQGTTEGMVHLADTKDIRLTRTARQASLVINANWRALEKIFLNLLNNAVKFTEKGGSISVSSWSEGEWAVVEIADTGIGIPPEEQPYIFDRFHQVDGSSTRRYRGTGLGLALVKELTEKMGGTVEVESAVGQGTRMTVRLPLASEGAESDPDTSGYAEDDGLEQLHRLAERRGGLTLDGPELDWVAEEHAAYDSRAAVLVVEDEPDMRRYLFDILEEEYRVLTARTGKEGLRIARERVPELVLLDLMLPEMDGLEVCRRIREEPELRSQKIMLLTARVDEQSKLTALEYGADDFLTKPFSSVEVRTRLRNLLATAVLERDLEERNRRLQSALVELEQTQAQLLHSEKLNALGSLAAGLLHEINNPLNYSLTALQLIREEDVVRENELLNEVIADIDEGMQRIRAIVTDLRAFAYPSEAEIQTPFELSEAAESALRFTSHEVKGIRVVTEIPQGLRVVGSRSHITQVLVNLLSNAVRAIAPTMSERSGEIRIAAAVSGARATVRVADNGIGMAADTLSRVFDPFFTTRDVGEGMGLGLSICHTIVSNHSGRLLVHSAVGVGTELVFDLPVAAGPEGS